MTLLLCSTGVPAVAASDANSYERARALYYRLKAEPKKQQFRHHWLKTIAAFRRFLSRHPAAADAAKAQFTCAELWRGLFNISRKRADEDEAFAAYGAVAAAYSRSQINSGRRVLGDDALWWRAGILERRGRLPQAAAELQQLLKLHPTSDMAAKTRILLATPAFRDVQPRGIPQPPSAGSGKTQTAGRRGEKSARVVKLSQWDSEDYTRVAVYFSGPVFARSHTLPAMGKEPPRIYVDVVTANAGPRRETQVAGALLSSFRAVQFDKRTVRIVLDLQAPTTHRLMVMESPFRVLVDIERQVDAASSSRKPGSAEPSVASPVGPGAAGGPKVAQPAGPRASPRAKPKLSKKFHVVLDPGHGGKDGGAVGKHITEKTAALSIAQTAATALRRAGVRVSMTRTDDTFVSLEGRTAMANGWGADLFISVHANAAKKRSVHGIETYYLNVTDNRYALRLAAVENNTSEDKVSDLQLILADMSTKAHTGQSQALAKTIQDGLVRGARPFNAQVKDNGVKASLFYVLLGARMPAVLVETSFLSHPREGRLLAQAAYRAGLGQALADAVVQHLGARSDGRHNGSPL